MQNFDFFFRLSANFFYHHPIITYKKLFTVSESIIKWRYCAITICITNWLLDNILIPLPTSSYPEKICASLIIACGLIGKSVVLWVYLNNAFLYPNFLIHFLSSKLIFRRRSIQATNWVPPIYLRYLIPVLSLSFPLLCISKNFHWRQKQYIYSCELWTSSPHFHYMYASIMAWMTLPKLLLKQIALQWYGRKTDVLCEIVSELLKSCSLALSGI